MWARMGTSMWRLMTKNPRTAWRMMFSLLLVLCIHTSLVTGSSSSLLKDPYWKSLLMNPLKTYLPTEDNLNNQSVIRQYFQTEELQTLNAMVTDFLLYPDEKMWSTVEEVSIDHPFILFHQRKAGGSSLRDTLYSAATKLKLPEHIPCKFRDCDVYTLPRDQLYAIYAAHYKWGVQSDLAKFNKSRRSQFSCATNYRHPISRIESCLYFRFGHSFQGKCLQEFDIEKFHNLLLSVDAWGTSCLNEPFRALSGYTDEVILDHLMDGVNSDSERRLYDFQQHHHPDQQPPLQQLPYNQHGIQSVHGHGHKGSNAPLESQSQSANQQDASPAQPAQPQRRRLLDQSALTIFNMTLRHTLKCTPLILEFPESYDLMSSRIPLLGNAGGFKSTVWIQVGSKTKKTCGHIQGEQLELTQRYAALEVMLYDAVLRKVLRRIADTDPNFLFHIKCRDSSPARDYIPFENTKGVPMAIVAVNGGQIVQIRTLIEYSLGFYTGTIRARREYMSMFPAEQYCGKRMVSIFAEVSVFRVRADPKNNHNAVLDYFLSASKKRCHHGMIPHFKRASVITQDPFFEIWKALTTSANSASSESTFLQSLEQFQVKKLKRIPIEMLSNKEKQKGRRLSTMPTRSHPRLFNLRHADSVYTPPTTPLTHPTFNMSLIAAPASASEATVTGTDASSASQPMSQDKVDSLLDNMNTALIPPPKLQAQEEEDEEKMSQQQQLQKGEKSTETTSNSTSNSKTKKGNEKVLMTGEMLEYQFYHENFDLFFDWYTFSWMFDEYTVLYRSYVNVTQAKIDGLDQVEYPYLVDLLSSTHGRKLPKFDSSNYLFISYDSILESAVDISQDTLMHTTFNDGGMTMQYNGTFGYTPENNALMRLLKETGYAENVKPSAVQCAFSHVQSASDQWLTSEKIKQIRAMRIFYRQYPNVFQAVKTLIKKKLNQVMLVPEQMRFLYDLN